MQRKSLIAKIHIGKNQLGLDDETYRSLLANATGKTSCTEMSDGELHQVLNVMVQKGFKSSSSFGEIGRHQVKIRKFISLK